MRTTDGFPQYRDYAELLQLLQHPRPGRSMVLKAPSHSAYLGEILSVMPQARIVTTYRDFSTVATSLLSLYRAQFGASTRSYDAREHALKVLELMRADGLAYAEARARHRDDFHDVFYADLVGDPVGTVRSIYESFDIDWPDGHEDRIDRYLKANPKGKHGRHRYSAEDFGITEQEIVDYVGPVAEAVLAAPSGR